MTSSIGHEILSTQIASRKELLKRYVDFIEDTTRGHGIGIEKARDVLYGDAVRELREFGSFSFRTAHGVTGRDEVVAWWYPARNGVPDYGTGILVLSVLYKSGRFDPNDPDCLVGCFRDSGTWQAALDATIARKDEIIAEKNGTTDEFHQHEQQEYERLRGEADRLGIVIPR